VKKIRFQFLTNVCVIKIQLRMRGYVKNAWITKFLMKIGKSVFPSLKKNAKERLVHFI